MRTIRSLLVLLLLLPATAAAESMADATAENWPHWRGPHLDGTSTETGLPTSWSAAEGETKNIRWRFDLPGPAGSTPIVWDDAIFVTSTDEEADALRVFAVGRDGELRWQADPDAGAVEVFPQLAHETNAAAPSPVTDGEHVWVLFGSARLFQFDAESGEIGWSVDLAERYGEPSLYFGLSTSPLLYDGRLYLQLLHADDQLVLALDAATGDEIWRHERPTDAEKESLHSYTSVIPFSPGPDESELLLVHGADYLTAHHSGDGREVWRFGTLNPKESYNPTYRLVATPVVHDGLVVVPTAKRGPVFGLRPADAPEPTRNEDEADGSIHVRPGDDAVRWTLERGTPDVPSPVVGGGLVYLAGENGRLTVLDVATGEEVYAERVHQSPHRGSPVLADGKLYLTATDGTVSVVKAGRTFELLSKNVIDAGRLSASPAVSGGTIFLRTYEALYAVGGR